MPSVCCYFQVHQPCRHRHFTFFDIDRDHRYEDDEKNTVILKKVVEKCYLPANRVMLELVRKYKGDFKVAFSITGIVLEQMETHCPEVIDGFKRLADTGCVEFLSETYYHSLAFLFSRREFKRSGRVTQKEDPQAFRPNTQDIQEYRTHL